ncbi:MAG TPA: FAD-dependent oxidoreductase [Nocardioidaceae bacterium]|nr:FAD-dependent oxidoreductase [Nocardioidaceae bacterium]
MSTVAALAQGPARPGRDPRAELHPGPAGLPDVAHLDRRPHVAVVGGGVAGVTAAVALAERGVAVTLLEREPYLGGRVGAWPVTLADGDPATMSRGFHAFFRQYYNLRLLLRRLDPTLSALVPLPDYPLWHSSGARDSFARLPARPPLNVAAFVRQSPTFTLRGLAGVHLPTALGLLDVAFPETYAELDGESAAAYLDRLRFPSAARHLALEVFARSFFAHPEELSAAELVAMFHAYFVGSGEGLLFDVPADTYAASLWQPAARLLRRLGATVRCGATVASVQPVDAGVRVHCGDEPVEADAAVLAADVRGLQRLVGASATLGDASWRARVAALRTAPAFAVWRLWLDRPVDPGRTAFLGTSGFGPLDNVSVLERFEGEAAAWSRRAGGSVVELHAYALPSGYDEPDLRHALRRALHTVYPETGSAGVVHEEWLVRDDCPLAAPGSWATRPTVGTPEPRVVLAGDGVRCDLPVALMERAATTGFQAADALLARWGVAGHDLWSVPTRPRLAPFRWARALRSMRAAAPRDVQPGKRPFVRRA